MGRWRKRICNDLLVNFLKMATINDYLDDIKTVLEAALPSKWQKVYPFRAAPEKYKRYAIITFMGGEQQGGFQVAGGDGQPRADFLVVLFAQFENTEESQEEAERDLNEAEDLFVKAILEDRSKSWLKAIVPYPTNRPRQPRSLPETRLAEIPLRLTVK